MRLEPGRRSRRVLIIDDDPGFVVPARLALRRAGYTVGHCGDVGTALDYLAESFMAGDPLNGGGFVIVNGIRFDKDGRVLPLDLPYAGGNLLSLASGGAIYVRDPHHTLVDEQLNGGTYLPLAAEDWKLILPYLRENERLFGIQVERDLLTVHGVVKPPEQVYTKVAPLKKTTVREPVEGVEE